MSPIEMADRVRSLPPYPFAAIDKAREKARAEGKDIINLGIGDPDLPTPPFIVEALSAAALDPATHRYPDYTGRLDFRAAAARFMKKRFGVDLDPKTEVLALIGSKEGIAHIPLAYLNPGDCALCPDPGYPVYAVATSFAGGVPCGMPLVPHLGYRPDFAAVPKDIAKKTKMMFLNYPNNPTGAVAPKEFLDEAVAFCREHGILLVYDNAYSELAFGGYRPPSVLEVPGGRDVAVEMHSLSKTFNMTGWRIGFAVGAAPHIGGLGKIKTNVDSGVFEAIQKAGIAALDRFDDPAVTGNYRIYARRRRVCEETLERLGFEYLKSPATFYVWVKTPGAEKSADFAARVLAETGVILTPGNAFGETGEGCLRLALTVTEERIVEALERVGRLLGR